MLTYTLQPRRRGVYLRMATDGVFDAGNWLPAQSANNNGDYTQEVADAGAIPRDRTVADGGVGAQQADRVAERERDRRHLGHQHPALRRRARGDQPAASRVNGLTDRSGRPAAHGRQRRVAQTR